MANTQVCGEIGFDEAESEQQFWIAFAIFEQDCVRSAERDGHVRLV